MPVACHATYRVTCGGFFRIQPSLRHQVKRHSEYGQWS
eukprot:COSAG02_NODE_35340_length_470_cov_0.552561_1_plen_37_part_10